jgi:hypothetical protein
MTDNARKTGPAVEAHFQFLMWLVPASEKFPRTQTFLLGDRIQTTAFDVLECLIEATYTRDRKGQLARANLGVEKLCPHDLRPPFPLLAKAAVVDRRRRFLARGQPLSLRCSRDRSLSAYVIATHASVA